MLEIVKIIDRTEQMTSMKVGQRTLSWQTVTGITKEVIKYLPLSAYKICDCFGNEEVQKSKGQGINKMEKHVNPQG